ncbi:MAG: type II secretion system F family protein [Acidimicrobiia bacterium]|nr:type II secretion system F family protein [Acidimicrobiia bacterium]
MTAEAATGIVFIAMAAFFGWIGFGVVRAKAAASSRLAVYGRESLREETLKKSVAERAVAPVILGFGRFLGRFTPQGWLNNTNRKLIFAGLQTRFDANSWAVVKLVSVVVATILFYLVVTSVALSAGQLIMAILLFALLGWFGPTAYLQRKVDDRKAQMLRDLPDVLDLLVISVEAGLGFDSALARVVDTVPGPLAEEFFRMLQETRVGVSRREAMRHLTERTDLDELRSFLLAMMQAEAFGVTISRVLRVQADEMRVKRRQRAQERAFAAPVKMVFPLVFCVFPALFVVLLGPAFINIYDNFINR